MKAFPAIEPSTTQSINLQDRDSLLTFLTEQLVNKNLVICFLPKVTYD